MEDDLQKKLDNFFHEVKTHLTRLETRIEALEKKEPKNQLNSTDEEINRERKKPLIEQRTLGDGRMGLEDKEVSTRLLGKEWSPLIVRKTYVKGWPMWVGLITDANLNDLDDLTQDIIEECENNGVFKNNIQSIRNFCGYATERIVNHYNFKKRGVVEGCAVIAYWDKCFCSALWGDQMSHLSCRLELYSIINTLPHI
jgi:hypothetical protein